MKTLANTILFFTTLFLVSCNSNETAAEDKHASIKVEQVAKDVTVDKFRELIKEPGQLVDVRTPGEFEQGMIEGAVNIDYMSSNFIHEIEKLDKSKPVYVYCAAGGRSSKAMEEMKKLGFSKVYNLVGGYGVWK